MHPQCFPSPAKIPINTPMGYHNPHNLEQMSKLMRTTNMSNEKTIIIGKLLIYETFKKDILKKSRDLFNT